MTITRRTFGAGVAAVAGVTALPKTVAAAVDVATAPTPALQSPAAAEAFAARIRSESDMSLIDWHGVRTQLAAMMPSMDDDDREDARYFVEDVFPIRAELRSRGWHYDAADKTFNRQP